MAQMRRLQIELLFPQIIQDFADKQDTKTQTHILSSMRDLNLSPPHTHTHTHTKINIHYRKLKLFGPRA